MNDSFSQLGRTAVTPTLADGLSLRPPLLPATCGGSRRDAVPLPHPHRSQCSSHPMGPPFSRVFLRPHSGSRIAVKPQKLYWQHLREGAQARAGSPTFSLPMSLDSVRSCLPWARWTPELTPVLCRCHFSIPLPQPGPCCVSGQRPSLHCTVPWDPLGSPVTLMPPSPLSGVGQVNGYLHQVTGGKGKTGWSFWGVGREQPQVHLAPPPALHPAPLHPACLPTLCSPAHSVPVLVSYGGLSELPQT